MDLELDRVAVEAEALRATRRACELFLESPETRAAFERVRGGDAVPPAVAFACRLALLAAGIGSPDDAVVGESASREATSSGYDGFERVDDGAFSFTFTSSSSSVSAAAAADPSAGSDPLARGDRGIALPDASALAAAMRAAAEDEASLAPARAFVRALVRAGVDLEAEVAATGDPVADAAARWSACVLRLGSLAGRREALEREREEEETRRVEREEGEEVRRVRRKNG